MKRLFEACRLWVMVLPQSLPDLDAFFDCTSISGFRMEQFLDISNEFSGCTTVSDSGSSNFWTIRRCLLIYWRGRENRERRGGGHVARTKSEIVQKEEEAISKIGRYNARHEGSSVELDRRGTGWNR